MALLSRFWSFFQIGLLSFGGGYAALPLIQEQVVTRQGWLDMIQFTDIVTISQMTPGPIAINAATFVGIRVAGLPGALIATFGCVLPSIVLVLALAKLYERFHNLRAVQGVLEGLRPAVVAMIGAAGLSMVGQAFFTDGRLPEALADVQWGGIVLFALSLWVLRRFRCGPIRVLLGSGAAGLLLYGVLGV